MAKTTGIMRFPVIPFYSILQAIEHN
jgi:hypothetical protein